MRQEAYDNLEDANCALQDAEDEIKMLRAVWTHARRELKAAKAAAIHHQIECEHCK